MVLLSFDLEEFDMPFEYGRNISFEDQINLSVTGCRYILDLLEKHQLKATFFSTAIFAIHAPEIIARIKHDRHELASHAYFHSKFEEGDLLASRKKLEEISGMRINGFRMPRMKFVSEQAIERAGYSYNSSLNPTYLPGRYNHLKKPRTYYKKFNVWQLPTSVTPLFRIPLFWLSFHNFPLWYYKRLFQRTYQKDGYANIYFHPWEFTDLTDKERFNFPNYVSKNSGLLMINRMDELMSWINQKELPTARINDFVQTLRN